MASSPPAGSGAPSPPPSRAQSGCRRVARRGLPPHRPPPAGRRTRNAQDRRWHSGSAAPPGVLRAQSPARAGSRRRAAAGTCRRPPCGARGRRRATRPRSRSWCHLVHAPQVNPVNGAGAGPRGRPMRWTNEGPRTWQCTYIRPAAILHRARESHLGRRLPRNHPREQGLAGESRSPQATCRHAPVAHLGVAEVPLTYRMRPSREARRLGEQHAHPLPASRSPLALAAVVVKLCAPCATACPDLRVPSMAPVLRRRRRVDDARVNDRPRGAH